MIAKPQDKFLNKVYLTSDVFATCLHHCLTSEKEEVMGLLIGEIDENKCISKISGSIVMHRSDKQPDRVEISPEQLCIASAYADKLSQNLHRPMRVIGWYHSHPHITVWPSHVDVQTQAMYQMMDPLFVGLIFAVYQNDRGSSGNISQVTCFQAMKVGSEDQRKEIELEIENSKMQKYNLEAIVNLPKVLGQEEGHGDDVEGENVKDPLTFLHNDAFHTLALVHIVSKVAMPILEGLEARLMSSKARLKELERITKVLDN